MKKVTNIYWVITCQALSQAQITAEVWVETVTGGYANKLRFNGEERETQGS